MIDVTDSKLATSIPSRFAHALAIVSGAVIRDPTRRGLSPGGCLPGAAPMTVDDHSEKDE